MSGPDLLVADAERIPTPRYYDKDFYDLEVERLWPHVWQMACRLEQIPEVGDWVEYSNLGKSVIVVRTRDGVKALHNACRHRGVRLAEGHGNCRTQGFICPFHGWRWNIEGRNTFVYGRHMFSERQLDADDLALPQARVELWGGCVFVNFDADAPSFRASMGPIAEVLEAHQVHRMRAEWWYATELPANWKIAMEAFMEGYHTMRTHPQLHGALPAMFGTMYGNAEGGTPGDASPRATVDANVRLMRLLSEGMAGMCHAKDVASAEALLDAPLPDDPAQALPAWFGLLNMRVTADGRARGEPTPDLNALAADHTLRGVEYLFPHYFLLPFLSSMSAYRVRPLAPERCLFEIWSLTLFPAGEEPAPLMEPVILPHDSDRFPPIPQQDYANIPRQQAGLHDIAHMRLGRDVEGLVSNYQRLIDGYLAGAAPGRLARATAALAGTFDGPIVELGLAAAEPAEALS